MNKKDSPEKDSYEQWLEDIEKFIKELKITNFTEGTPEYYFKKSMLLNYEIFKKKL